MIIKSHIRGGYRAAADYLKEQGKNEKIRLVHISDPDANNLDEAFHNMWTLASTTKATKPLHHISINPMKDERLTDGQVLKIVKRCEEKYGYKHNDHQRVIVEHILNDRQHFHVMWCRVSLATGKTIWPGQHWKKSKQVCREMERELGLKRPMPKKLNRMSAIKLTSHGRKINLVFFPTPNPVTSYWILPSRQTIRHEVPQRPTLINHPVGGNQSSMCEAQRIDLKAACEGKITWGQYFEKWGKETGLVPR